jgi:MFS family permease
MALIFSARSVGYLLGAFIGGFLFDIFDKQLLLTATLLVAAVATMIIPWALTLVVLAVMFSLQGVAMGVLDTGNMFLYYMCIFFIFIFYFLF